jgi:CheY-like chemotaxis protein
MAKAGFVLIVEDDDDLREVEAEILDQAGYRIATARDGREGMDIVDKEMPALIFLDMKMPGMDGWAFTREFRARYDRRSPIVVVTAAVQALARAEEIAADGLIEKPFEASEFIKAVKLYLSAGQ